MGKLPNTPLSHAAGSSVVGVAPGPSQPSINNMSPRYSYSQQLSSGKTQGHGMTPRELISDFEDISLHNTPATIYSDSSSTTSRVSSTSSVSTVPTELSTAVAAAAAGSASSSPVSIGSIRRVSSASIASSTIMEKPVITMDHMANMANNRPLSEDYNLVSHRLLRRKSSANIVRRSLNPDSRSKSTMNVTMGANGNANSGYSSHPNSMQPRTRPMLRKAQSTAEFGMGLGIRGGAPNTQSHLGSVNRALRRRLSSKELELLYDQNEDANTMTDPSDFLFNVPMSTSKYRPRSDGPQPTGMGLSTQSMEHLPIIDETGASLMKVKTNMSNNSASSFRSMTRKTSMTSLEDRSSGSSTPSCSRQPGLPPKSSKELEKHQKEFERILLDAASAQQKKTAKITKTRQERCKMLAEDTQNWTTKIIPNFHRNMMQNDPEMREMWWRGVPAALRPQVWQKQIGNDLKIDASLYDTYSKQPNNYRSQVEAQCSKAFPNLHIFRPQTGPLHQDLANLICAYMAIDPVHEQVGLSREFAQIAAVILLNAACASDAFVMLCNTVHPGTLTFALLHGRDTSDAIVDGNIASFVRVMRHKLPLLFDHLRSLGLAPLVYISPMIKSRFTDLLNLDHAMRVWDVYIFEGDAFLLRTALSVLDYAQHSLVGCDSSHKALDTLAKMEITIDENQFMDHTRSILHA